MSIHTKNGYFWKKEINTWRKEASHEERIKFAESGAGEMLYTICSGIRLDQTESAS